MLRLADRSLEFRSDEVIVWTTAALCQLVALRATFHDRRFENVICHVVCCAQLFIAALSLTARLSSLFPIGLGSRRSRVELLVTGLCETLARKDKEDTARTTILQSLPKPSG